MDIDIESIEDKTENNEEEKEQPIEKRLEIAIQELEKVQKEKQKLVQENKELEFSAENQELYERIKDIQTKTKHKFDTVKEILSAIGDEMPTRTIKLMDKSSFLTKPIKRRKQWGTIINKARSILKENPNTLFTPSKMAKITGATKATLSHTLWDINKRIPTVHRTKIGGSFMYWEGSNQVPTDLSPSTIRQSATRKPHSYKYSQDQLSKAKELYEQGKTYSEIGNTTGIKVSSVGLYLKQAGATLNRAFVDKPIYRIRTLSDMIPTKIKHRRTEPQQAIPIESSRKARELYEQGKPLKEISEQTGIKLGSITHSIKRVGGTIDRHPEKGRRFSSSSSTLKEEPIKENHLSELRKAIKSAVKIKGDIELPSEFKKAGVYPHHIDEMVLKHGEDFDYDQWFTLCYRLDRAILLQPMHIIAGYKIVKDYLKNRDK